METVTCRANVVSKFNLRQVATVPPAFDVKETVQVFTGTNQLQQYSTDGAFTSQEMNTVQQYLGTQVVWCELVPGVIKFRPLLS